MWISYPQLGENFTWYDFVGRSYTFLQFWRPDVKGVKIGFNFLMRKWQLINWLQLRFCLLLKNLSLRPRKYSIQVFNCRLQYVWIMYKFNISWALWTEYFTPISSSLYLETTLNPQLNFSYWNPKESLIKTMRGCEENSCQVI